MKFSKCSKPSQKRLCINFLVTPNFEQNLEKIKRVPEVARRESFSRFCNSPVPTFVPYENLYITFSVTTLLFLVIKKIKLLSLERLYIAGLRRILLIHFLLQSSDRSIYYKKFMQGRMRTGMSQADLHYGYGGNRACPWAEAIGVMLVRLRLGVKPRSGIKFL